ncbi:predicted protein [Uncinocarpus reesii 1704]|uniref:Uncharacterized protein n=1 Tax=Uncinocarpus reesii (strain UAMH 1704) TaxID=336963 RepID=C4JRT2_UNCRE|nr:uncharacterized protein UREG_05171 [Uncinocarpus reesii 1704]EEP80329.1 predicted protein [Uncinocarpus reesii 1704]
MSESESACVCWQEVTETQPMEAGVCLPDIHGDNSTGLGLKVKWHQSGFLEKLGKLAAQPHDFIGPERITVADLCFHWRRLVTRTQL